MDLYNTLTNDVYRSAVEHYEEIVWVFVPQNNLGPQKYLFYKFHFCLLLANKCVH